MYRISTFGQLLILLGLFWLSGCENAFEPLQENDRYAFSMYGTLDVYTDMNWIRVMPVGKTLIYDDPQPNGVRVTLTHQRTGEQVILRDSLHQLGLNSYVWNYWTDTKMDPDEIYTVTAESPDGNQSRSVVTLPSALPIPDVEYITDSESGRISGSTQDKLVKVTMRYLAQVVLPLGCGQEEVIEISHLENVFIDTDGGYRFTIRGNERRLWEELGRPQSYIINKRELVVVSASEDWPDLSELSDQEVVLPDVVTNVENGTGLITGTATRKVIITPQRAPCGF